MRRDLRADGIAWRLMAALITAMPAAASADVQINRLSDMAFGALPTTGADQVQTESVCAASGLIGGLYSVTATGSGSGGLFTLANGSAALPYEVQWSATAGQSSGTNLTAGSALTGLTAALLNCTLGPNASLIVVIRGAQIVKATAGSYSGTLTIILSAN